MAFADDVISEIDLGNVILEIVPFPAARAPAIQVAVTQGQVLYCNIPMTSSVRYGEAP